MNIWNRIHIKSLIWIWIRFKNTFRIQFRNLFFPDPCQIIRRPASLATTVPGSKPSPIMIPEGGGGRKEINGKRKIAKILQEEVCPKYKRTFYILHNTHRPSRTHCNHRDRCRIRTRDHCLAARCASGYRYQRTTTSTPGTNSTVWQRFPLT